MWCWKYSILYSQKTHCHESSYSKLFIILDLFVYFISFAVSFHQTYLCDGQNAQIKPFYFGYFFRVQWVFTCNIFNQMKKRFVQNWFQYFKNSKRTGSRRRGEVEKGITVVRLFRCVVVVQKPQFVCQSLAFYLSIFPYGHCVTSR